MSAEGQGRPSSPGLWYGRSALGSGSAVCAEAVTLGARNGHRHRFMGAETWLVRYRYVGLTRGNRRDFIILAGGAIALPSPSRAQQPAKLPSNGFLGPSTQVNLDHSANSRRAEAACGIDPVGVSHVFASRHQHAFARQPSGRHFLVRCLSESRPGSRAGMLQSSITGRPSAVCVHCEGAFTHAVFRFARAEAAPQRAVEPRSRGTANSIDGRRGN
jgi:hypothetical protein